MLTDKIRLTDISAFFTGVTFKPLEKEKFDFEMKFFGNHLKPEDVVSEEAIEKFFASNNHAVVELQILEKEPAFVKLLETPWRDGWGRRDVGLKSNSRDGINYQVCIYNIQDTYNKVFNIYSYLFRIADDKYVYARSVWKD